MVAVIILIVAIISLCSVVLARTIAFKPHKNTDIDPKEISFDKERAIESLRALVRCKTISYSDPELEDNAEFDKLIDSLPALYPYV